MKKKSQNLKAVKAKNFVKNNSLLLIFIAVVVVVGAAMVLSSNKEEENLVYGDDVIDFHFFHLSTCPHCHAQIRFHPTILEQYPNVRIIEYEISESGSREKYIEFASQLEGLDQTQISTPTTIVGEQFNVGYGSDATSGQKLLAMVAEAQTQIDANWDDTKIRTVDLRAQLQQ